MSTNAAGEPDGHLKTLDLELGVLQRALRTRGVPVIVVVEGWNASGISDTVAAILYGLDPRGVDFHAFGRPGEEDLPTVSSGGSGSGPRHGEGLRSLHDCGTRGRWTRC